MDHLRELNLNRRDGQTRTLTEGVGSSNKKPRQAQLGTELLARLEARRLRYPTTTYVFENSVGNVNHRIDRMIERVLEKAGVSKSGKLLLHSLRKTFATRLKNDAGYDVYKISKLLGHSDVKTTEIYLGDYDPDSETAGDDIEQALAG